MKQENTTSTEKVEEFKEKIYAVVRKDAPGTILGLRTGHLMIFNAEREAWAVLATFDKERQDVMTVLPLNWSIAVPYATPTKH